jgi:nucleoside-diphosphate kinase
VNGWKKLIGAEDLSTGGLRATYGTDSLRNGFHASEDSEVAVKEINFFFPQLSVEKIPNLLEVEDLLNKKPAPRPHVEPKKSLNDVLVDGLTQLCRIKPVGNDAIEWLGEWLEKAYRCGRSIYGWSSCNIWNR